MERLTEKHYSGNGYYLKCSSDCPNDGFCDDCEKLFNAIDRLGEYEDKAEQKPKTNADRIQEKLAETLSGMCKIAEQCDFCPLEGNCPGGSYDLHVWSEWLQQPAEGE